MERTLVNILYNRDAGAKHQISAVFLCGLHNEKTEFGGQLMIRLSNETKKLNETQNLNQFDIFSLKFILG